MKPRQTVKNYHNSNAPLQRHNNLAPSATALGDIDLTNLGPNSELDISGLPMNPNLNNQDEFMKCFQAIYGKNNSDALQNLQSIGNWPMQSVSPPEFNPKTGRVSLGGSGVANSKNGGGAHSTSTGVGLVGRSSGAGSYASCVNTGNNNNDHIIGNPLGTSSQHQDIQQFSNSQHQTQPSAGNHQFRISNTPSSMQLLQQQKSVLSLHQHQSNDSNSGKKLSHHQHHHLNTSSIVGSPIFTNFNSVNTSNSGVSPSSSTLTTPSSTSLLDTNNSTTLSSNLGNKINPSTSTGVSAAVPNIMDSITSMDNIFYDNSSMPVSSQKDNQAITQQSLIKHQQLQKLLKATTVNQHVKSSSSMGTPGLSTHRADSQRVNNGNHNLASLAGNMSHQPQHFKSSGRIPSRSPPPPNLSSVPKSLLNLAACTSSSPLSSKVDKSSLTSSMNKFSSMVSQLTSGSRGLRSANNSAYQAVPGHSNSSNIGRSFLRNSSGITNDNGHKINNDTSKMLQQMAKTATASSHNTRPNNKQMQMSLLSDDQAQSNRLNLRTPKGIPNNPLRLPSQVLKQLSCSSKEAYMSGLQEMSVRVGLADCGKSSQQQTSLLNPISRPDDASLGIINDANQQQANIVNPHYSQPTEDISNLVDRKEIESALSQVESRNDLSLLYPPMILASNSQKQLNALSAGITTPGESSELFTEEIRKVVLEECNIIYECKGCNNLFRSLANLVKHKRTYCTDHHRERNNIEINKRSYVNSLSPSKQTIIAKSNNDSYNVTTTNRNVEMSCENDSELASGVGDESKTTDESSMTWSLRNPRFNLRASEKRKNSSNITGDEDRNPENELTKLKGPTNCNTGQKAYQTSLSKLLQSQPKSRLPVIRDNALLGAINGMSPVAATKLVSDSQITAIDSDKNMITCPPDHTMHEQLVRNSSLAKTLLNEKVKNAHPSPPPTSSMSSHSLSKLEPSHSSAIVERVGPKRKLLEDCIQKVKRDKLLTEDEEEPQGAAHSVSEAANDNDDVNIGPDAESSPSDVDKPSLGEANEMVNMGSDEGPSKGNSSIRSDELPSDRLMIDLEEQPEASKKPTDGVRRHLVHSDTQSSSASSSTSSKEYPSSSALLKALTRPVEAQSVQISDRKSFYEAREEYEPNDYQHEDENLEMQAEEENSADPDMEDSEVAEDEEETFQDDEQEEHMKKMLEHEDDNLSSYNDDDEQREQLGTDNDYPNDPEATHGDSQVSDNEESERSERLDDEDGSDSPDDLDSVPVSESGDDRSNKLRVSSTKTPPESGPSSTANNTSGTSSSGSSGLMKLKITLKTRSDEKSKVYEIV